MFFWGLFMKKIVLSFLILSSMRIQSIDWFVPAGIALICWNVKGLKEEWDARQERLAQKQNQQEFQVASNVQEPVNPELMHQEFIPATSAIENVEKINTSSVVTMHNGTHAGIYCLGVVVAIGMVYGGYVVYKHMATKASAKSQSAD